MTNLPDLSFDFKASAAQALREHPDLKATTAFYDPIQGAYFEDKVFEPHLGTRILDRVRRFVMPERMDASRIKDDLEVYGPHVNWHNKEKRKLGVMAFSTTILASMMQHPCGVLGYAVQGSDLGQFAFSHELGHLVFGISSSDRNLEYNHREQKFHFQNSASEVIADTFAAYAETAKGRAPSEMLEKWSDLRAFLAINGDVTHYTSPALDAFVQIDRADIIGLPPATIRAIAARHAEMFKPDDAEEVDLHRDFADFKYMMTEISAKNTLPLKKLAQATIAAADRPLSLYTGAKVLSRFMSGAVDGIKLEGDFWDQTAADISNALKKIPHDHILRQLDLNKVDILQRQEKPITRLNLARVANHKPA